MHVSLLVWAITLVALVALLAVDLAIIGRRPHEPSMKEASIWVGVYVTLAIAFGLILLAATDPGSVASSLPAGSPNTACRSTTCSCS